MTLFRKTMLAALSGAVLTLSQPAVSAETWDMPLAYSATNYHSQLAAQFAKDVNARLGDEIEIVPHPGGSLYKGSEIFGAVRRGLAPIGERLISALGNEDPIFEVDALPFVATSFEDSWKLYQASKPAMEKVLSKKGLKLLYAVPWPPQGLYANKEINSVGDMKGLKFRAYNTLTSELAVMMGAVPTKIEAAELSQAFATGVAESMISSGSTGYDRKLWEYVGYWYDTKAWLPKNMVVVNKRAWKGLSDDAQKALLEISATTEKAGWDKAEELANWYKSELAKNGMKVNDPGQTLQADFQKLGEEVVAKWLEKAGDEGKQLMDSYKKM